jgi:hypothetical protein
MFLSLGSPYLSYLPNTENDLAANSYCGPAVPNSTGESASIDAFSPNGVSGADFVLYADGLPAAATTFFLASRQPGFEAQVPGSAGAICLGGSIGRFVGPGQVQQSQQDGQAQLTIDRMLIPQPNGFEAATVGSVWFFQAWFRDVQSGQATSNFTDGISVAFE